MKLRSLPHVLQQYVMGDRGEDVGLRAAAARSRGFLETVGSELQSHAPVLARARARAHAHTQKAREREKARADSRSVLSNKLREATVRTG